jgi:hypothetical protein
MALSEMAREGSAVWAAQPLTDGHRPLLAVWGKAASFSGKRGVGDSAALKRWRRMGKASVGLRGVGNYIEAFWPDPDDAGNVCVRGPLPVWLREKMTAAGFDPDRKDHRDVFKQRHLIRS